jgi:hypothetical protein
MPRVAGAGGSTSRHEHWSIEKEVKMATFKRIWIPLAAAALALVTTTAPAQQTTFSATLTGASELPEPTTSKAEGELTLAVSPDGKKVDYKLTVKDIRNAVDADIHLGGVTANGPLVVKLFPTHGAKPKRGDFTGVLAEGSFTAADLVGPLTGSPLSDLLDEFRTGNAYTNVHTNDGVAPSNTGPGDMQHGEIRGQIK